MQESCADRCAAHVGLSAVPRGRRLQWRTQGAQGAEPHHEEDLEPRQVRKGVPHFG